MARSVLQTFLNSENTVSLSRSPVSSLYARNAWDRNFHLGTVSSVYTKNVWEKNFQLGDIDQEEPKVNYDLWY